MGNTKIWLSELPRGSWWHVPGSPARSLGFILVFVFSCCCTKFLHLSGLKEHSFYRSETRLTPLVPLLGGLSKSSESKVSVAQSIWLFVTPWTVDPQAPQSMEFSRQEYWSGLPFPSPRGLPDPGMEPGSPALKAGFFLLSEPPGKPVWPDELLQGGLSRLLAKSSFLHLIGLNPLFPWLYKSRRRGCTWGPHIWVKSFSHFKSHWLPFLPLSHASQRKFSAFKSSCDRVRPTLKICIFKINCVLQHKKRHPYMFTGLGDWNLESWGPLLESLPTYHICRCTCWHILSPCRVNSLVQHRLRPLLGQEQHSKYPMK